MVKKIIVFLNNLAPQDAIFDDASKEVAENSGKSEGSYKTVLKLRLVKQEVNVREQKWQGRSQH